MSDPQQSPPTLRAAAIVAAILSAIGALASYTAAGATLGFLFGGVLFATLIAPPFALIQLKRNWALSIVGAVSGATALTWFLALRELGGFTNWILATLILTTYLFALCAITRSLSLLGIAPIFAQAITIAFALAWLSCPMWLRIGSESFIAKLVLLHSLMNLNSLMIPQGVWTQQHIMYRLTALGQDVPYQLPTSIWICVIVQSMFGAMILIPVRRGLETRATG